MWYHNLGRIDAAGTIPELMMRITTRALLLSLVLMPGSARADTSTPMPKLEVGQRFPGTFLPSLTDGRPMSLLQFRGQKVILHIFASW